MRTPNAHQSTMRPHRCSRMISGAINSGVPQNVDVVLPNHMSSLHSP